jgi:hypothetical protein
MLLDRAAIDIEARRNDVILTPNTKAQPIGKYSTLVVAIVAVVLTVATDATLIELNRRGRAEFDELKPDLAISMPNIRHSIGISGVRCSQGTLRSAKKWLIASLNLQNEWPVARFQRLGGLGWHR